MGEILRVVKGMQTSDKNGVDRLAGWPENELVGGRGIVPPAKDIATAQERLKQHDCCGW